MEDNTKSSPITEEGREAYLISLAYDLVEKRLREGTATSQETTHFLKLGSSKERLEKQLLAEQVELAKAKTENLQVMKELENTYREAMDAFMSYRSSSE